MLKSSLWQATDPQRSVSERRKRGRHGGRHKGRYATHRNPAQAHIGIRPSSSKRQLRKSSYSRNSPILRVDAHKSNERLTFQSQALWAAKPAETVKASKPAFCAGICSKAPSSKSPSRRLRKHRTPAVLGSSSFSLSPRATYLAHPLEGRLHAGVESNWESPAGAEGAWAIGSLSPVNFPWLRVVWNWLSKLSQARGLERCW